MPPSKPASTWETKPRVIFPLSLLSFAPRDEAATMNAIIQYGIAAWVEQKYGVITDPGVERARHELRFNGSSAENCRRAKAEGDAHVQALGAGPDALVAMPMEWCLSILQRRTDGFSFRDFRVLCAIYSFVGRAGHRWITQDLIAQRTSGAKSEALLLAHPWFATEWRSTAGESLGSVGSGGIVRKGFLEPLSPKQVRKTIADLVRRKCFARYSPIARSKYTYYSVTMSTDDLAKLINAKYVARVVDRQRQAHYRNALQAELAALAKSNVSGHVGATAGPRSAHQTATAGPPKGDINETFLNETLRNETLPNETNPHETRMNGHVKAELSRRHPSVRELIAFGYDGEQAAIIDHYHLQLVPLGYLPVTSYSEELVRVLERHGRRGIGALVTDVFQKREHPAKGHATLVRLGWDNY